MEKVDSCHDGHELFRNPKQRLGGKRDIAGSKQSKNENGKVKVVVIDWKQTRKIRKDWCMLKVGGNIAASKVAGVVQRIDIDEWLLINNRLRLSWKRWRLVVNPI